MTARYQPDQRLQIITDGTRNEDGVEWRGGEGVAILIGTPGVGGIYLEISPDNGTTWVKVRVFGINQFVFWDNDTDNHALNFRLPACRLRASDEATGINAFVVSV